MHPLEKGLRTIVQDPLLDEVIRRYVQDREPGAPLPAGLHDVTELDASCLPIRSVENFRYFEKLRYLDLSLTDVCDLSALAALPQLEELHLTFHQGFDIASLKEIETLKRLDISYPRHRPYNLGEISYLDNLEELYANGCGVNTMAHFVPLEKLQVLTVSFNSIPEAEVQAFRALMPGCALLD